MKLKKYISGLLGFAVQDWDQAWIDAETQGRMTNATTNKILLELCKRVERLEDEISSKSSK